MTGKEMWEAFCKENGTDINSEHDECAFCGGGPVGDELAELTLSGIKTATASAYIAYETEDEDLPKEGSLSVILKDCGDAVCIIKSTKVSTVPFEDVSPEHAYKEGEGDRSLSYWRTVHKEAFASDYESAGKPFNEKDLVVLEEFEVIYK